MIWVGDTVKHLTVGASVGFNGSFNLLCIILHWIIIALKRTVEFLGWKESCHPTALLAFFVAIFESYLKTNA